MYSFIDSDEWCLESMRELKIGGTHALDIETQGLDQFVDKILLIQVGFPDGKVNIYDARKISQDAMKQFLDYFFDISGKILLHNAKFDLKYINYVYGCVPKINTLYDTGLAEWVLTNGVEKSNFHSYKDLVKKYCNIELEKDIRLEFVGYEKEFFSEELLDYAAKDVTYIFEIAEVQNHYLTKNDLLWAMAIENNVIPATMQMELSGSQIDVKYWLDIYRNNIDLQSKQLEETRNLVSSIKTTFYSERYKKEREYDFSAKPFNPNSSEETLAILKYRGVKLERRSFDKKTKKEIILYEDLDTTDAKVLEKLNDEVAKAIIKYRQLGKLSGTYGDSFLKDIHPITGRIHANYHQNGAGTGRYSSSNPNLQNIPIRLHPEYRDCFVEEDPYVQITADYSQIEMRLAAELSGDEVVINAFLNDEDLHAISASAMYDILLEMVTKNQRSDGKKFNFSVLYGAEEYNVSVNLEIPIAQARIMVANWRAKFSRLSKFLDEKKQLLHEQGYVTTLTGRRKYWVFTKDISRGIISKFEREAANMPIQGTSADITKIALTNIYYRIQGYDAQIIRTVHDEITVRCHKDIAEGIRKIMETEMIKAGELFLKIVPVKVDVSEPMRTWAK
jgi:DNA polymerase I